VLRSSGDETRNRPYAVPSFQVYRPESSATVTVTVW
jgi:hypothetical protein